MLTGQVIFSIPTAKQNIALLIFKSTMVLFVSLFFYFSKFCFGAFEVETPVAKTPVATPVRSAAPDDLKNLRPPSSLVSGPGQPSSQPLVEAQPRVSATGVETLTENQVPKPVGVTERKAQSSKPCICFADIIIGT